MTLNIVRKIKHSHQTKQKIKSDTKVKYFRSAEQHFKHMILDKLQYMLLGDSY